MLILLMNKYLCVVLVKLPRLGSDGLFEVQISFEVDAPVFSNAYLQLVGRLASAGFVSYEVISIVKK